MTQWRRAIGIGAVVVVACALLPLDIAGLVAEAAGIVGLTALWRGSRRNGADPRPFKLFVFGGCFFLVGNVVRAIYGIAVGVENPFPSPADPVGFVGYCLVIAGVLLLVRRRSAQIEGDNLLDAVLVAMCLGVLTLLFVVQPYLGRQGVGAVERGMTLLYTLFDLVLVSVIVRLAVGSGRRSRSYYLLGAASAAIVFTDIFFTMSASSSGAAQRLAVTAAPLCYLLAGAAGMHPSVVHLTDPPSLRDIQLTPRRLAMLFAVVVGMVSLLVVGLVAHDEARVAIAGVGAVGAILVVLGRLALLVQANERKARREALLRDAAGAMARATSVREMNDIAVSVLADVVPGSTTMLVDGEGVVTASAGSLLHPLIHPGVI
jgi:hypothetical protein